MATFARDISTPASSQRASVQTDALPTIGTARFGELNEITKLHQRCFRKALAYRLSTVVILRLMPRTEFLVARVGDRIVGNVIGDLRGGQSRVVSICVDPDWRGQGIGSRLLTEIETALPTGNMILMVEANNVPAHMLYRAHGYLSVGESRDYYGRGRHGIWMQKNKVVGWWLQVDLRFWVLGFGGT